MRKILVVGGDIDVIRALRNQLPDHEIVTVTEHEASKKIVLIDEFTCSMGEFLDNLCRPMEIDAINELLIPECIQIEAYQEDHSFRMISKPNPAARYYHKFTQPYGQHHRNGRRC